MPDKTKHYEGLRLTDATWFKPASLPSLDIIVRSLSILTRLRFSFWKFEERKVPPCSAEAVSAATANAVMAVTMSTKMRRSMILGYRVPMDFWSAGCGVAKIGEEVKARGEKGKGSERRSFDSVY